MEKVIEKCEISIRGERLYMNEEGWMVPIRRARRSKDSSSDLQSESENLLLARVVSQKTAIF